MGEAISISGKYVYYAAICSSGVGEAMCISGK